MKRRGRGKAVKRAMLAALLLLCVALAVVITGGGGPIRWFGKNSERMGHRIKAASDKAAVKADDASEKIHEGARGLKDEIAVKIKGRD